MVKGLAVLAEVPQVALQAGVVAVAAVLLAAVLVVVAELTAAVALRYILSALAEQLGVKELFVFFGPVPAEASLPLA
jgi:hypothetical protein